MLQHRQRTVSRTWRCAITPRESRTRGRG
jgi:hypothetical protein